MKRVLECLHQGENHVFIIVFFDSREIQIGREAVAASEEHLAKARAALEGKLVQNAALGHQLEQVGERDLLFGDHDVAQPGFGRVALDLWTGQNGSVLPVNRVSSRDAGTVAQFVAGDIDGKLPTVLITDCTGFGNPWTEKCFAAPSC